MEGDKMVINLTSKTVKEYAINEGASVVGIADAKDFISAPDGLKPTDILAECLSVIVLGSAVLREAILADDTVGFIDVRNEVNKKVTDAGKDMEKWLKSQGYKVKTAAFVTAVIYALKRVRPERLMIIR